MEAQWLELSICVWLKFIVVVRVFAMARGLIRRPFTAEVQVRLWTSLRKIYGRKMGTGRGFSPSTSVFPSQDHYTKTPYSSSFLNFCSEGQASENWECLKSNPAVHCEVGGAFGRNSSPHTLVYSPQTDLLDFFLITNQTH